MPKKEWTEAERKAFGDKMRKARENAKRAKAPAGVPIEEQIIEHPEPQGTTLANQDDYQVLLDRIKELESRGFQNLSQPQATVTPKGVIGTTEKYAVNPDLYPDPTERLSQEERLQQFAFQHNYELEYEVAVSQYETKDGLNMKEPKFMLQLNRVIRDDNGEATDGRYVVCRLIMHEDPQSAITVATDNGILVPDDVQLDFLNEMRYLQMRDWVLGAFYPPNPNNAKNKKEVVVDGQLVEFFEINSEKSETIPFGELKKSRIG